MRWNALNPTPQINCQPERNSGFAKANPLESRRTAMLHRVPIQPQGVLLGFYRAGRTPCHSVAVARVSGSFDFIGPALRTGLIPLKMKF